MKVLIVSSDFPPLTGGISRFAGHVAAEAAARGHDVRVIAPAIAGARSDVVSWHETRTPGYEWGFLRGLPMLAALLCAPRPDMVLAMNLGYGGLMSWVLRAAGFGAPYCAFAYGLEFARHEGRPWMRALYRRVLGGAERVFAISSPIRERLLRFAPDLPPERVGVLWPGVEAAPYQGRCRDNPLRARLGLGRRPVLLSVSRLVPRKGHDRVIEALPELVRRWPDLAYVVVGDGPHRPWLQERVARYGVESNVVWAGELPDEELPDAYAMCDVFVLPCREDRAGDVEGFGIVFVEAGAAGRPVVGGDSGGVRDAVVADVTGLLVDPGSPEAVAAAVTRLLADPAEAARMGEAGRRRAQHDLSWPEVLSPLVAFLEGGAR